MSLILHIQRLEQVIGSYLAQEVCERVKSGTILRTDDAFTDVDRSLIPVNQMLDQLDRRCAGELGLKSPITVTKLKSVYRQLVLDWHPDKVRPELKEEAAARFREIQDAYEYLRAKIECFGDIVLTTASRPVGSEAPKVTRSSPQAKPGKRETNAAARPRPPAPGKDQKRKPESIHRPNSPETRSRPSWTRGIKKVIVVMKVLIVIAGAFAVRLAHEKSQSASSGTEPDPAIALRGEIKTIQALQPEAETVPIQVRSTSPFINSLGMRFVPVPGAKVLFCIHETRNADYAVYAAAQNDINELWRDKAANGREQHPVVRISYEDAESFCQWLSAKEGKSYRLPTDEEWSFAVGLVNETGVSPSIKNMEDKYGYEGKFPWGNYYPPEPRDGNYDFSRAADGYDGTSPTMSFKANGLGIYDMGGNALEWCQDWYTYKDKYTYLDKRVQRGAYCLSHERAELCSSRRSSDYPKYRGEYFGFRCVLVFSGN